ncbi:autotransporter domain-containing protein [Pusillimonas sp. SM2304]|uniref:autotransporter domain-containing protein n=1 Tax=Pusillimonas sp. SM2304 TaxID=3073241 RepID=UPI002875DF0E|nr:autotransporter domain-containing protein [Pusillimonas sp. SM2304]MDS1141695.1 autotransporter domain-containing protein [Pusillimonas sp. SM2304]
MSFKYRLTPIQAAVAGGVLAIGLAGTSTAQTEIPAGTYPFIDLNTPDEAVTQTGAVTVNGTTSIDAGAASITLAHAGNDFVGAVSLAGGTVFINDANALTLGALSVGALTATSQGALDLGQGAIGGALSAASNGGAISQSGPLSVTGTSTIDAGLGSISLADDGNDFVGPLSIAGTGIQIVDANDLTIASLVSGANANVTLIAGGALVLANGGIDVGNADLTLASNGGVLSTAGALAGARIELIGSDGVTLSHDVDSSSNLTLTSGSGAITQTGGNVSTQGDASIDAGNGSITLSSAGNDFVGAVSLKGGAVSIRDANALTLGALSVGALTATSQGALDLGQGAIGGALSATSNGGTISQSGPLSVTGTSMIDAGAASIELAHADNDFVGAVNLTGGAVSIRDANALTLGVLSVGALTASSQGALTLGQGAVGGDLTAASNGGAISQSGAFSVGGASTINAGAGSITLNHAGNDFVGPLTVVGTGIQIASANDLTIASLANGANANVALVADGVLSLPAHDIDVGNADLALASKGGALSTAGALRGARIELLGRNGISLNHNVTATSSLALEGVGGITQSGGAVTATAVNIDSDSDVVLTGSGNVIGRLDNVRVLGNFSLKNQAPLLVNTLQASHVEFSVDPGVKVAGVISTGQLAMNAGQLRVDGLVDGDVQIMAGASLAGTGTVGNTTIASGGALAPGNSIGTLTVDGDLVFDAGSRYLVEVDPQGSGADLVHVTGAATLAGGSVVHIGADGAYDPSSAYRILKADGSLSGAFDTVTSDFAFLTPGLAYDYGAGTVDLLLERNQVSFPDKALTRNQLAAAAGVESLGAGNAAYNAVVTLPDDAARIRAGFDALSGEIHASAKTALIEESRFVRDAVIDRIRTAFGAVAASATPVHTYGANQAGSAAATTDRFAAWGNAFGSWGHADNDGNAARLKRSTRGLLVGADGEVFDAWRAGVVAGYSRSKFDAAERASSGESDNYHLGLYGGRQWGRLGLRSGLAYTWHNIQTHRSLAIGSFSDRLSSDYHAGTFQIFGELGYRIDAQAVSFEPFAALAHISQHTDGYTENGAAAALQSKGQSTDTTFTTLGLRAATHVALGRTQASVRGGLGWRHAFGDTLPTSTHRFSAGDAFTVAGVPIARNAAVLEAGLDLLIAPDAVLSLSYTGQIASEAKDHGAKATLSMRF